MVLPDPLGALASEPQPRRRKEQVRDLNHDRDAELHDGHHPGGCLPHISPDLLRRLCLLWRHQQDRRARFHRHPDTLHSRALLRPHACHGTNRWRSDSIVHDSVIPAVLPVLDAILNGLQFGYSRRSFNSLHCPRDLSRGEGSKDYRVLRSLGQVSVRVSVSQHLYSQSLSPPENQKSLDRI